jgi:hypothetical protein
VVQQGWEHNTLFMFTNESEEFHLRKTEKTRVETCKKERTEGGSRLPKRFSIEKNYANIAEEVHNMTLSFD